MEKTINIDCVETYNKMFDIPTRHPLITVVDIKNAPYVGNHMTWNYGLYALFLKNGVGCTLKYGRRKYDYQAGTVVTFSPGKQVDVEVAEGAGPHDIFALLFHPDLIYGTPLGQKIASFDFFDYSQMEALHLSDHERGIFVDLVNKISTELDQAIDSHTASVLSANIQLLLEYLDRFYDRQFITRHKVNSEIVAQLERMIKEYYDSPQKKEAIPSVNEFAARLCLTPKYLSELVKRETGLTTKVLIMQHLVNVAKHRLAVSSSDVSEIAYELGFQYPAHFSRMFKRITGQSPTEFRMLIGQN